jgi:hypothetical protein
MVTKNTVLQVLFCARGWKPVKIEDRRLYRARDLSFDKITGNVKKSTFIIGITGNHARAKASNL